MASRCEWSWRYSWRAWARSGDLRAGYMRFFRTSHLQIRYRINSKLAMLCILYGLGERRENLKLSKKLSSELSPELPPEQSWGRCCDIPKHLQIGLSIPRKFGQPTSSAPIVLRSELT